jgi:hypothetical protein
MYTQSIKRFGVMATNTIVCLVAYSILVVGPASAQDKGDVRETGSFASTPYPVVFGKPDDGFPNRIHIQGTVVEASPEAFYCGAVATGGTLKIRLDTAIEGYPDAFVYLFVLCYAVEKKETLVNQRVVVDANKLVGNPYGFGVSVSNQSDSKGTPFYYLKDFDGNGGLLPKIRAEREKK